MDLEEEQVAGERIVPRGNGRRLIMVVAVAAAILALAGLGWSLLAENDSDELGMVFIIPAGSSARVIPWIETAVDIPTEITFQPGETPALTVINEDNVTHRAGPFVIYPGQTYTQRFNGAGSYSITCSVDPAESITVTVLE